MSGVTYNYTASSTSDSINCTTIKEVLSFLSWTHINDNTSTLIKALGLIVLSGWQHVNMLNHLSEVVCIPEALTMAFLLGMGPAIQTYTSWATKYGLSGFALKYFAMSSVKGPPFIEVAYGSFLFAGSPPILCCFVCVMSCVLCMKMWEQQPEGH
jgi:hypothetical protein